MELNKTLETHEHIVGNSWDICSMVAPMFLCWYCSALWWCSEFNLSHHSDYLCQRFSKGFVWCTRIHLHRSKLNRISSMMSARYQYQPLIKAIFSSPEIFGNILHIFWGGIKTTKIAVYNKLRHLKLSCLVRYHGMCSSLSCIGTLVSQKTRLVECGVVRMWETESSTITVYLIPMSQWMAPLSSVTSKILQDSILSIVLCKVILVKISVLLG